MRSLWNQMLGREPEPVWMSVIGCVCVFATPFLLAIVFVAMGAKL